MSENNFNQEAIEEVKVEAAPKKNGGAKVVRGVGWAFQLIGGAGGLYFGFIFVSNILNWIGQNYKLKTTGVTFLDVLMTGSSDGRNRGSWYSSLIYAVVVPLVAAVVCFGGGALLRHLCKDIAFKMDGQA